MDRLRTTIRASAPAGTAARRSLSSVVAAGPRAVVSPCQVPRSSRARTNRVAPAEASAATVEPARPVRRADLPTARVAAARRVGPPDSTVARRVAWTVARRVAWTVRPRPGPNVRPRAVLVSTAHQGVAKVAAARADAVKADAARPDGLRVDAGRAGPACRGTPAASPWWYPERPVRFSRFALPPRCRRSYPVVRASGLRPSPDEPVRWPGRRPVRLRVPVKAPARSVRVARSRAGIRKDPARGRARFAVDPPARHVPSRRRSNQRRPVSRCRTSTASRQGRSRRPRANTAGRRGRSRRPRANTVGRQGRSRRPRANTASRQAEPRSRQVNTVNFRVLRAFPEWCTASTIRCRASTASCRRRRPSLGRRRASRFSRRPGAGGPEASAVARREPQPSVAPRPARPVPHPSVPPARQSSAARLVLLRSPVPRRSRRRVVLPEPRRSVRPGSAPRRSLRLPEHGRASPDGLLSTRVWGLKAYPLWVKTAPVGA